MKKRERGRSSLKILNRIILLNGNRETIFKKIKSNQNEKIFFLKVKGSVPLFVYLLNNSDIEQLILLPSIYKLLSKKVISALKKSGVELKIINKKVGRPKRNIKQYKEIIRKKRLTDNEKIKLLGISRRTYYYYKNELKK